jgi:hypothetical protein
MPFAVETARPSPHAHLVGDAAPARANKEKREPLHAQRRRRLDHAHALSDRPAGWRYCREPYARLSSHRSSATYIWPLLAPPLASSGLNGCAQHGAKLSVMLYVPLATHSFTAGFAAFGIEQNPFPPSS